MLSTSTSGTILQSFQQNQIAVTGTATPSKILQFNVDTNVPASTTVTLTVPSSSGVIMCSNANLEITNSASNGLGLIATGSSTAAWQNLSAGTGVIPVLQGGTGESAFGTNLLLCSGTASTNAFQTISSNTSGLVLTSNGSGSLPTWQAVSGLPSGTGVVVVNSGVGSAISNLTASSTSLALGTSSTFNSNINTTVVGANSGVATSNSNSTVLGEGITCTTSNTCVLGNAQSVVIGDTASKPCAQLYINSTTGGVLLPNMTDTQMNAISNPLDGLLLYSTTGTTLMEYNNFNHFDSTGYQIIPGWNPVTSNDTVFIGGEGNTTNISYSIGSPFTVYRIYVGRDLIPTAGYLTGLYIADVYFNWSGLNSASGNFLMYLGYNGQSGPTQGAQGGTITMYNGITLTSGYTQLSVISCAAPLVPGTGHTKNGFPFAFYLVESGSGVAPQLIQISQLSTSGYVMFSSRQLTQD